MTWPLPFWIAHRGAGKLAPENTLAAFRVGASQGYRAFECDVKLSRDGVPFLLHDAKLDRTTNARGIAGERDWAELDDAIKEGVSEICVLCFRCLLEPTSFLSCNQGNAILLQAIRRCVECDFGKTHSV